jgi:serine O-acetyltransferase
MRELLKLIRNVAGRLFVLPMLLPFVISRHRELILTDVNRWVELEHLSIDSRTAALLHLLCFYKEFRNLYYYRLKQDDVLGAVLVAFYKLVYKEPSWLVIRPRSLGPGFFVQHGVGSNINGERIGANCRVNQQVTIGFRDNDRLPRIGNNVHIGAGARVLGDLTVGDNVIIGANAVVTHDVPPDCTVAGVPARIIRRNGQRVDESLS